VVWLWLLQTTHSQPKADCPTTKMESRPRNVSRGTLS